MKWLSEWKSVAALGGSIVGVILSLKLTPDQLENVLVALAGALKLGIVSNNEY